MKKERAAEIAEMEKQKKIAEKEKQPKTTKDESKCVHKKKQEVKVQKPTKKNTKKNIEPKANTKSTATTKKSGAVKKKAKADAKGSAANKKAKTDSNMKKPPPAAKSGLKKPPPSAKSGLDDEKKPPDNGPTDEKKKPPDNGPSDGPKDPTSCARSRKYRTKAKITAPGNTVTKAIHMFIVDDTRVKRDRNIRVSRNPVNWFDDNMDSGEIPEAYHAFPHKRVDPNNRWRHMRNVDFCELLQLAESDPAILFWDAQWQNQKDPFFMEPCDEGHDDTNAQGLIDRAPTLRPIIPLKPQNDETDSYETTCFNQLVAPYIIQEMERKAEEATGKKVEVIVCWTRVSYLNQMLTSDKDHVDDAWKHLFSSFVDFLWFCRPDNIQRIDELLSHLTHCQHNDGLRVYPPVKNLIAYTQPYRGRNFPACKGTPGLLNPRVVYYPPRDNQMQSALEKKLWGRCNWNEFFLRGVADLKEFENKEDNSKRNASCNEINLNKRGFILKVHHKPAARREGEGTYHLTMKRKPNSPVLMDPTEIMVRQLSWPPVEIRKTFQELLSRRVDDKDGAVIDEDTGTDKVEWLEHSIQPFCEGFWKKEYHLYGKILKSAFNKWQQVIVGRDDAMAHHGELKLEYAAMNKTKGFDTNFLTKPTHKHRQQNKEESFLKVVKTELASCGIVMAEHLPLRIDACLEKRFGPHSIVAALNAWGNFPARDLQGITYGAQLPCQVARG